MTKLRAVAILGMLMIVGGAGAASAQIYTGFYDFADTQYSDDFTAVRRGSQMYGDGAPDLGGTGHTALNFTGRAGAAGDTWLAKWTPGGSSATLNGRCGIAVAADILVHPFNNRKGAGLVTLLNDAAPGDKGLALILYDNGNTDAIQLATIDPSTGALAPLRTLPLFAPIDENAWYVVFMTVNVELAFEGHDLLVEATVLRLQDPADPNSEPAQIIGGLRFKGGLEPLGLHTAGQVGIMASAIGAVVDSSVTNWIAAEGFEGPCSE